MKVLNLNAFCKTHRGEIGMAAQGTFAASAWRISDEAFHSMSGRKFSWIAPDGGHYTDDRDIFTRPTEQEVLSGLSWRLKEIAIAAGVLEDYPPQL